MKLTRRGVLFGASSLMLASERPPLPIENSFLTSQSTGQRVGPIGRSGVVDSHVHIWSFHARVDPPAFTLDDFLLVARPEGVERAVLIQPAYERFDNSYILEAIRTHPTVFRGVGLIDYRSRNALREMHRLAAEGLRGFRIPLTVWGTQCLRSPSMRRVWDFAADSGLLMCLLLDPDDLPSVRAMCRLCPRTTVVIDHLARIGVAGKIRRPDVDALCGLAVFPRTYVKVSAFYALGRKRAPYLDLEAVIRPVFDAFGARRLMWGSDAPFQLQGGHGYADSLGLIRQGLRFPSAEDREWLLTKTATGLYFQDALAADESLGRADDQTAETQVLPEIAEGPNRKIGRPLMTFACDGVQNSGVV